MQYAQVVVSLHGPLSGRSLRDVNFRQNYGGAVVAGERSRLHAKIPVVLLQRQGNLPAATISRAVHRHGHMVSEDLASIKLHAGDVLVIEAGEEFRTIQANSKVRAASGGR